MQKIEDYIHMRKGKDKLDEFDFSKRSENMGTIIQYVSEYFNDYLTPLTRHRLSCRRMFHRLLCMINTEISSRQTNTRLQLQTLTRPTSWLQLPLLQVLFSPTVSITTP